MTAQQPFWRRPMRIMDLALEDSHGSWVSHWTAEQVVEIAVQCPACGGYMRIVAALTETASIQAYLEGVGLPARPPPIAPARPSQQPELDFAA